MDNDKQIENVKKTGTSVIRATRQEHHSEKIKGKGETTDFIKAFNILIDSLKENSENPYGFFFAFQAVQNIPKDERKKLRLKLIWFVIIICAIGIAVIFIMIFADLICFKKDIFNAPAIIIIATALLTTLTAALGAVIGSSID